MTNELPVVSVSEDGGFVVRQGFLDGPPRRYRFRVNYPQPVIDRVASILEDLAAEHQPDDCWPWPLSFRGGYGVVYVRVPWHGKHKHRAFVAHRAAWVAAGNTFPNGDLTIDHICHNTACVNPSHLRLLTLRENALDAWYWQLAQQAGDS